MSDTIIISIEAQVDANRFEDFNDLDADFRRRLNFDLDRLYPDIYEHKINIALKEREQK